MRLLDRFSAKVLVDPSGCWLWNASKLNGGYGRIREGGLGSKTLTAHRASWLLHKGDIPEGLWVLHKCDVRRCVNPDHLFLGTPIDNARDRDAKDRRADQRGEMNGASRLTNQQVRQIRSMRKEGKKINEISAATGGVPKSTITNVCLHTWKHIE